MFMQRDKNSIGFYKKISLPEDKKYLFDKKWIAAIHQF